MASRPVLVVEHATPRPAEDSLIAGELLAAWAHAAGGQREPRLARLRGSKQEMNPPGSTEHATADGALVANGFLWPERALGRPVGSASDEILGTGQRAAGPEVIAFNPVLFPNSSKEELRTAIDDRAWGAIWIEVKPTGSRFQAVTADESGESRLVGEWVRDRYGRPVGLLTPSLPETVMHELPSRDVKSVSSTNTAVPKVSAEPRLVLVGEPEYHRAVYPAVLAAIGDASDALGFAPIVEIISPRNLGPDALDAIVATADGLLLPGGSDLGQVAGQISLATAALARNVPTLGICLGMQSMTLAVARSRAGLPGADLEEVNPQSRPCMFTRLRTAEGIPEHRLGDRTIEVQPRTRLAALYGRNHAIERLNHRYKLNQSELPALKEGGLTVGAMSDDAVVIDGVECTTHPFFIGLQGHPELSSRAEKPHPLLLGFLGSAAKASRRKWGA